MSNSAAFAKTPTNTPLSYFLLAFITMAGLAYINFLPGVVNSLASGIGFTEAQAGQIVALNGYGGLLGSTIAIFLVQRVQWRPTLFALLAVLTLLDIGTVRIDNYSVMLSWRFFAGVVGGLSLGLGFSLLARMHNPDRAFGTLLFVQFSIGSLVIYLLPGLEQHIDAYAVFYVMAGCSLLSLLFISGLPGLALNTEPTKQPTALSDGRQSYAYRQAFLLLSAITLYQIAASAIWAYVALIGLHAGIAANSVNTYIAITGLLGLAGALLPMLCGRRFGRLKLLMAGMALSIAAAVLLHFSQQALLYILAMGLLFFSWPAVLSYLIAVSAEIDSSGKLSTLVAVLSSVGLATGPLLASALLAHNNYTKMLSGCVMLFSLTGLLMFKPVQSRENTVMSS